MKTAEEILKNHTGHAHGLMDYTVIEAMKEYAKEVAKQALINASESSTIKKSLLYHPKSILGEKCHETDEFVITVDHESILNESNIPNI